MDVLDPDIPEGAVREMKNAIGDGRMGSTSDGAGDVFLEWQYVAKQPVFQILVLSPELFRMTFDQQMKWAFRGVKLAASGGWSVAPTRRSTN